MDVVWLAALAIVLVMLVVTGWKAIRTGEMVIESIRLGPKGAIFCGWMQVILGLGLGFLIIWDLLDHFLS